MKPRLSHLISILALASALPGVACNSGSVSGTPADTGGVADKGKTDLGKVPACAGGTDKDCDGYGLGCPQGDDCNDSDPLVHPGATEVCDGKDNNCDGQLDEGVTNACGTCDRECKPLGGAIPFPVGPNEDPGVQNVDGVGLDSNGDLVLDKSKVDFNYMWIANTNDLSRGTVSKIDTVNIKEVARYFTVTCYSQPGAAGCVDLHGSAIDKTFAHKPSRTAVDFSFDVWVANRAFNGQPSASKIANRIEECIDRDKDGKIETSKDLDGDGRITTDCNGDGLPDDRTVTCTVGALAGGPPEFYGDDDECVLWTVNYGGTNELGRAICLAPVKNGASDAWVLTHQRSPNNQIYRIDGTTGALDAPIDLPAGHNPYGCAVDSYGILWSTYYGGNLAYVNTVKKPAEVGPLVAPTLAAPGFYGISLDDKNNIWLGSYTSGHLWRYRPDRATFASLGTGTWTAIKEPNSIVIDHGRGVAADNRGWIWTTITNGYLWRVSQSITDGYHDLSADTNYWKTPGTNTIGVGIDFKGHVWTIDYGASVAGRMDLDKKGDPVATAPPMTDPQRQVPVGTNPYTYSDFTGFGLKNFSRPQGSYVYELDPCKGLEATWMRVEWKAATPPGTGVSVRVRSGDGVGNWGAWFGPYSQSPALLKDGSPALVKNPSHALQVELTLTSQDKTSTPIVHDLSIGYSCTQNPG